MSKVNTDCGIDEFKESLMVMTQKVAKKLDKKIEFLTQYIESVLSDYIDINEDTRMQLEIICKELAEHLKKRLSNKYDSLFAFFCDSPGIRTQGPLFSALGHPN